MEVEEETPPRHPHSRRERGYFTASPRQDRMTYFSRLLLSRGASSAPLISNRKSRGEPRRTAGQSARARAPFAPAVSAGKKKKDRRPIRWDTTVSPDARFRGICIRARASYPPCRTSNNARRSSSIVDSRICNRVGSACFVSSSSSSSFVLVRLEFGSALNGFVWLIRGILHPARSRSQRA